MRSRHPIEVDIVDALQEGPGDLLVGLERLLQTWTALHTGELNGVPASNRPVRVCGDAFDRIENGKLVEHHAQFDVMGLLVQIGAVPVPS